MDQKIKYKWLDLFSLVIICALKCQSKENYQTTEDNIYRGGANDSLSIRREFASSPVISPEESLKLMMVEDGFEVKLVASEPLVSTPVALSFDEKGRVWVVEMSGYMPDITGTNEAIPNGKIVILEDIG